MPPIFHCLGDDGLLLTEHTDDLGVLKAVLLEYKFSFRLVVVLSLSALLAALA